VECHESANARLREEYVNVALTGNEPRQKYLFAEISRIANVIAELPFDQVDPMTKYLAAALSFKTSRREWWLNYHMHSLVQRSRRKVLNKGLQHLSERPDALLMWGSWFNPVEKSDNGSGLPFFNYIDQSLSLKALPEEPSAGFARRRRSFELQSQTYRQSSGIFCMSEWCRQQTLEAHPSIDSRVIHTVGWGPCGVDLSSESIPEDFRQPVVLHVSGDFYRKGVDFLCETAKLVKNAVPEARFIVIGRDDSGMSFIPTSNVEFTGQIKDKGVLSDYFRRASIFFLPHRFDRSPHVLVEAMSAGLSIVTSAQGGAIEVTDGTGIGFMHAVGDVRGYSESIIRILRDRSLRTNMGINARQLMLSRYNWRMVARRIVNTIESHLHEPN
jgi:glycogen synthase